MRSEGDPKIVLRSIGKINRVAYLKTKSDWSPEALDAGTRINGKLVGTVGDAADLVSESSQ